MPTNRDYYEILGVPRSADGDAVRNAYRRLAKQLHPDVNRDPAAEERFKEINEAYGVLSNEQRRAAYDRFGHAGLNGMPFGNMAGMGDLGDIFDEFFRGFGMGGRRSGRSPRRGADLQMEVRLTFEEAISGIKKDLEVTRSEVCSACRGSRSEPGTSPVRCSVCGGSGEERRVRQTFLGSMVNVTVCSKCGGTGEVVSNPCKTCRGTGLEKKTRTLQVPIPAGVDDGMQIRLAGEGEPGVFGGPHGNLFLLIRVQEHKFFRRKNSDLWMEVGINFHQAALGAQIRVPTAAGESTLHIPAGTQPGQVFRLRGRGMPHLQQSGRGDFFVVVNVVIPAALSGEQKKLLAQLGIPLDESAKPQERTLLDSLKEFRND
ncbi:MAG: molecular chaperone DnaJ [Anaerolineales bacterium]|nr:molecular chaperone DnaJ [Anaerolineales bacterium]